MINGLTGISGGLDIYRLQEGRRRVVFLVVTLVYVLCSIAILQVYYISQFWCNLLHFLMVYFAYYMAIRSGNWVLHNACIKQSCDLLFAYARDKYEVLAVQTLSDVLTYPTAIIQQFEQGHWTASKLGVPFHNQALDELHETKINCGLKQVVSRPPYFQVVELSNFLAYLENVVSCFCSDVGKTRKSKIVHDTHLPTIVTDMVEKSLDLKCLDAVELHNVFCPLSQVT